MTVADTVLVVSFRRSLRMTCKHQSSKTDTDKTIERKMKLQNLSLVVCQFAVFSCVFLKFKNLFK